MSFNRPNDDLETGQKAESRPSMTPGYNQPAETSRPIIEKPFKPDKSEFKNKAVLFRSELQSERMKIEEDIINEPICFTIVNLFY